MTKSLITICGWLLCVCVTPPVFAEDEQESPKESVRINVLLVNSDGNLTDADRKKLNGKTDAVLESLEALKASGKLRVANHCEMVVIEDTAATFQIGEMVPMRTGSTRSIGGRRTNVYQDASVGTLVKLRTKVVEDGISVQISFAKSSVKGEVSDDTEEPQGVSTLSHQASLGIKNGTAQLMGGMSERGSDDSDRGSWLIVSAETMGVTNTPAQEEDKSDDSVLGDVQIEVVPELGTIVLRGKSDDVKRVQAIISEIEKRKRESEEK
ncbi:MAG: hypothetical protein AAGG48_31810 [Planctomycetota bacterium]